jgi:DNA-directed RNA polymerase subunit beta'
VIIGKLIPAGSGLAQYRQEDVIDDEGNLIAQARRRPEREVNLDFSVDEDEDESDSEGDDLFSEIGPLELEPASSEPETQEAEV